METSIDPVVLGAVMIILTTASFAGMSWAGMHEDETPRRHANGSARPAEPWWTHDGFDDPSTTPGAGRLAAVTVVAGGRQGAEEVRAA